MTCGYLNILSVIKIYGKLTIIVFISVVLKMPHGLVYVIKHVEDVIF